MDIVVRQEYSSRFVCWIIDFKLLIEAVFGRCSVSNLDAML
jgi:hypothetical protein